MKIGTIGVVVVMVLGFVVAATRAQDLLVVAPRCLHDTDETQANRLRREDALTLARAINGAQGRAIERTGRYQVLADLGALPPAPEGFVMRIYADEDGYIFSIKDSRDACRYGIFSDQHGTLYQSSPTVPLIAS